MHKLMFIDIQTCRFNSKILLALYVDDLLFFWSKESLSEVKERLKLHFTMKHMECSLPSWGRD